MRERVTENLVMLVRMSTIAVSNSVMVYLWCFGSISLKIKHKLYTASGSTCNSVKIKNRYFGCNIPPIYLYDRNMVDALVSEISLGNMLYNKSITYDAVNTQLLHYKEINVVWGNTGCLF